MSYVVFTLALAGYLATGSTLVALILLCTTDIVAFIPTLVKNFKDPTSDTPLFYIVGAIAPAFAFLAASDYGDINQTIVPVYLVFVNILAVIPILLYKKP